jgi:hypothetical protein
MATATYSMDIKLEYGIPQVFAPKFLTGKDSSKPSLYPPFQPRVGFTMIGDRKLWLDAEDGSDLERGMRDLGVQVGDFIRVTKIKHPRGGGHSIRVELAEDANQKDANRSAAREPVGPSRLEAQLEKSLEMAQMEQTRRAAPLEREAAPVQQLQQPVKLNVYLPHDNAVSKTDNAVSKTDSAVSEPARRTGTFTALLQGALIASLDAYKTADDYAKSKGIPFEFLSEDVRASANAMLIEYWRSGGTR